MEMHEREAEQMESGRKKRQKLPQRQCDGNKDAKREKHRGTKGEPEV